MRRREFIMLLGGATVSWPLAARAQQPDGMRRVGVLMNLAADDPAGKDHLAAFVQALDQLGWSEGRNVHVDVRWAAGDAERYRIYAAELVNLAPDILLSSNASSVRALRQLTRAVPIVFAGATDPVGDGFVETLAHPGGSTTGFMLFEYGIAGKWLQLLKELMPSVTRAGVVRDQDVVAAIGEFGAIQAMAPSLGIELRAIDVREIERGIPALASQPNGGLIVLTSGFAQAHRELIVKLAAVHRLPAVYWQRLFVTSGGLLSYGPSIVGMFRQAAGYVDRILKGEKPSDLPVQAPTKYELVINLKTAKSLDLTIPATLLARADEVIE